MSTRRRPLGTITAALLFLALFGCSYTPADVSRPGRKPAEPLYEDPHILEIAWQLRDISIRAISEAETREVRNTPLFEPLGFTTFMGLSVRCRVGRVDELHHYDFWVSGPEERLTDETALHLLHFAADLLGVEVPEALLDGPGRYRLSFDLDAHGQTAFIENLTTRLEQDDILRIWKEAVLQQVSIRPMALRKTDS